MLIQYITTEYPQKSKCKIQNFNLVMLRNFLKNESLSLKSFSAGSHLDISISINIRKICVNWGNTSINLRMAIAKAHFTSQESKIADNEAEIELLLLLSRRNRIRLLMQRETHKKKTREWSRYETFLPEERDKAIIITLYNN